ncbi:DUF488 family protein [Candidatus Poriferisodalis sp.]|uniref:DUF488 domain-containing protein n=1 Tax=Candidatus Poriferisodalis sp. TaxID=3101277 RepID=UPI003B028725
MLSKNERTRSRGLDDLMRLSQQIQRRTEERDSLLARLHAEGCSLPELASAAEISVGKAHKLAHSKLNRIDTIGYEGRNTAEFVEALTSAGVTLLVDVRENAMSRVRGFSKSRLQEALAEAGIAYEHMKGLGNPKENRYALRSGDERAIAYFNKRLLNGSADDLRRLGEVLQSEHVALLCFERDHQTCHRSLIVDALQAQDRTLHVVNL